MFLFKQKTAYEMRISDWSSDVCSSDLRHRRLRLHRRPPPLGVPGRNHGRARPRPGLAGRRHLPPRAGLTRTRGTGAGTAMAAPTYRFVRPFRRQPPLRTGRPPSIDRGKYLTYALSYMADGRAPWHTLFVPLPYPTLPGTATHAPPHPT